MRRSCIKISSCGKQSKRRAWHVQRTPSKLLEAIHRVSQRRRYRIPCFMTKLAVVGMMMANAPTRLVYKDLELYSLMAKANADARKSSAYCETQIIQLSKKQYLLQKRRFGLLLTQMSVEAQLTGFVFIFFLSIFPSNYISPFIKDLFFLPYFWIEMAVAFV